MDGINVDHTSCNYGKDHQRGPHEHAPLHSTPLQPEVALANSIAISAPKENMVMIDLHGLSETEAKRVVTARIKEAASENWDSIRIVTGRGNHVNAKGQRGTLYNNFKDWLQDVKGNILQLDQYDGYYEIDIKKDVPIRNPFEAFFNAQVQTLLAENIDTLIADAANGDVDSTMALAVCYEKGIGVEQDYKKSTDCFLQIKDSGNAIVEYELGCRYYIGKGIRQNDAAAVKYFTLSADKRYATAAHILGIIYWRGMTAKPDYGLGHQYFLIAAEEGNAESARRVGCSFHDGLGCNANQDLATDWWKKGAEGGDCTAAFNLVSIYEKSNPVLALKYLKMSAELGDPDGQFYYGLRMYFGTHGLPRDPKQGLIWITSAAAGSRIAQYFLAQFWVKRDNIKAKHYLILAADNGDIEAQFFIVMRSVAVLNTLLLPTHASQMAEFQPFDQAYKDRILCSFMSRTADEIIKIDNKDIQSNLINLLVCQDSTKKQNQTGVTVLRKLIAVKDMDALVQLASLYMTDGLPGIKKNLQEAFNLWSQGAKAGNADCYRYLGNYWRAGLGGKVAMKKALASYDLAATKGCSWAAMFLSKHYIDEDNVEKYFHYLSIAAELGDEPAKVDLERLAEEKQVKPLSMQMNVRLPFFANRRQDEKKDEKPSVKPKRRNKK